MDNQLVTIFGATGLVGRAITEHLCEQGFRVRAASRQPNEALFLKTCGGPAQVQTAYADISDNESVARAVQGAGVVINCVGILYESTGKQKFTTLQAEGPGLIARAARKAGAKTLIHISAIGADEKSRSKYARSKRQGELAVKAAFPKAVVLRPSIIFGANDSFFNSFAKMAKNPLLPIPVVGPGTRFQPVYVADVAEAAIRAVLEPEKFGGHIYELGGPGIYTFRELLDYLLEVIGVRKFIVAIPFPIAGFIAWIFEVLAKLLPITPPLTLDQVHLLKKDNVVSEKAKGLKAFGITPTSITSVVPGYLRQYRRGG